VRVVVRSSPTMSPDGLSSPMISSLTSSTDMSVSAVMH
jgi:hypothetical protein